MLAETPQPPAPTAPTLPTHPLPLHRPSSTDPGALLQPWLEAALGGLQKSFAGQAAGVTAFSEEIAHWIMAAADYVLVPSRFEPCGLVAQCGVRYGAVPIVTAVGGLKDLVTPEVGDAGIGGAYGWLKLFVFWEACGWCALLLVFVKAVWVVVGANMGTGASPRSRSPAPYLAVPSPPIVPPS